jgi:hypothetical protein
MPPHPLTVRITSSILTQSVQLILSILLQLQIPRTSRGCLRNYFCCVLYKNNKRTANKHTTDRHISQMPFRYFKIPLRTGLIYIRTLSYLCSGSGFFSSDNGLYRRCHTYTGVTSRKVRTKFNVAPRRTTAPSPVLSPSSILSPPSSRFAFIPARENLARVLKIFFNLV